MARRWSESTAPRPASSCRRCTATRASSGSTGSSSPIASRTATGSSAAMTATPGSAAPMAVDPRLAMGREARVVRFGLTERRLHTAHAAAVGVLLVSGFALYLPVLAQIISDRPLMKSIHLVAAALWLTALALAVVLGDRDALRRTRREI